MALVDEHGTEIRSSDLFKCPRCGAKGDKRKIHTFFGGHWKRICECGHVYDEGKGLPPLDE